MNKHLITQPADQFFLYSGIESYENLTETAVDISNEVPSTSDCVYTQNVVR